MTTGDQSVRNLADQARNEMGLSEPPVNAVDALGAYQLTLPAESLDERLAAGGVSPDVIQQLDAMIDLGDGCVFVREGMHDRKKNWGYLHELAHKVIPWHRDLLYRCSILRLPPFLQRQFEREADQFAAEIFFFGNAFLREAMDLPFGLETPRHLAASRYDVSLHAAFMRYAEDNPETCCLLVSSPVSNDQSHVFDLRLRYYAKSRGFRSHIPPNQTLPGESDLGRLFNSGALRSVIRHELELEKDDGSTIYEANSFTNSYNVFTLIWKPRPIRSGNIERAKNIRSNTLPDEQRVLPVSRVAR